MLAGLVASRVLYRGESLLSFKLEMGGFIVVFVLAILGPFLMSTPKMAAAKRKRLADYGQVAQGYVDSFEERWVLNSPPSEEVLGSGDIQSLTDLNSSYAIVGDTRGPVWASGCNSLSRSDRGSPSAAAAHDLSPGELIIRLIKIVF